MTFEGTDITSGFWETVRDSAALRVVADIGEVGLDSLLLGPLRDVPVFGSALNIWAAGAQIRDLLFLQKLCRFLTAVHDGCAEDAKSQADRFEGDAAFRKKVGFHILSAVDQLDDLEKAELLARSFSLLSKGTVGYDTFREFTHAIGGCVLADLRHLADSDLTIEIPASAATRLSSCGLVELHAMPTVRALGDLGNNYHMTQLGRQFARSILRDAGSS